MTRFPKLRIPIGPKPPKANTPPRRSPPGRPRTLKSRGQATTPSPRGAPPLAAVRVGHDQPPATGQSRDVHARSQTKSKLRTRPAGGGGATIPILPKCGHCLSYLFS